MRRLWLKLAKRTFVYLRQDSDGLAQINQYLDTSEGAASMFSLPADVGYHREPANTLSHATESGADTSLNQWPIHALVTRTTPATRLIGDSPIGAGSALTISQISLTVELWRAKPGYLFVDSRLPDYQQSGGGGL